MHVFSGVASLATCILFLLPSMLQGSQINGRLSSCLKFVEDDSAVTVHPYLTLMLDGDNEHRRDNQSLSFHLNGRWTDQRSDQAPSYARLYRASIRATGFVRDLELTVGRQFISSTAGSASMDGALMLYRVGPDLRIESFGGSEVSLSDPNSILSISRGGMFGARALYAGLSRTRLSTGWFMRRHEGDVEENLIGIEGSHIRGTVRAFVNGRFSLLDNTLAGLRTRLTFTPEKWYFSGEYNHRKPSVSYNSLFSLIESDAVNQLRIGLRRTVCQSVGISVGASNTWFGNESTWRLRFGFISKSSTLSWLYQDGHRGKNSGLVGSVRMGVMRNLDFTATANVTRYRIQNEQEGLNDSYVVTANLGWKPISQLSASLETQYLANAVTKADLVLLIRISKSFAVGFHQKE